MHISLISWIRNEADILEAFIRHHAAFADDIRIVLHRCRDNSAEILEALKKEGLPMTFRTDERLLHEQDTVLTGLAFEAMQDGADWILPLDADEFLTGDVRSALKKSPTDMPAHAPWKGYVPTASDDEAKPNVLKRITHRRENEPTVRPKIMIPAALLKRDRRLTIGRGNHRLRDADGKAVPSHDLGLSIAHFPVRSRNQLFTKITVGWLSNLADPARPNGTSFQWKELFDRLKAGNPLTPAELSAIAARYPQPQDADQKLSLISDPVPCSFDVSLPVRTADPMSMLLETAEDIAASHADLSRKNS